MHGVRPSLLPIERAGAVVLCGLQHLLHTTGEGAGEGADTAPAAPAGEGAGAKEAAGAEAGTEARPKEGMRVAKLVLFYGCDVKYLF